VSQKCHNTIHYPTLNINYTNYIFIWSRKTRPLHLYFT